MLSNYIRNIDTSQPLVLFLRHAERYPIDDMKDALSIKLTAKGHEDSISLGKDLSPLGPFEVYHSPVPRCGETAIRIAEGLNYEKTDSSLKGPLMELGGPYVHGDWRELVERTRDKGPSKFIREWFNTGQHNDIMIPFEVAAQQSLAFLVKQLNNQVTPILNVTHDWNIMILREYYHEITHEAYGMPVFLDGIALYKRKGELILSYHENEATITNPPELTDQHNP